MFRQASAMILATLLAAGCASSNDPDNQKARRGAGVGAAAGAVVGAIIGNQSGDARTGAVIGAAAGAAIGGAVGHQMDKQQKELEQIEGVEVTRPAENQIDVRLTSDVLFDYDSSELRPESRQTLRNLAANFSRYSNEVFEIEGHTDSAGSDEYNAGLSQRRADAVAGYLMDQGVPRTQIEARGYGESRPKASNDTPEGRQLNRRVEIHIRADHS